MSMCVCVGGLLAVAFMCEQFAWIRGSSDTLFPSGGAAQEEPFVLPVLAVLGI